MCRMAWRSTYQYWLQSLQNCLVSFIFFGGTFLSGSLFFWCFLLERNICLYKATLRVCDTFFANDPHLLIFLCHHQNHLVEREIEGVVCSRSPGLINPYPPGWHNLWLALFKKFKICFKMLLIWNMLYTNDQTGTTWALPLQRIPGDQYCFTPLI